MKNQELMPYLDVARQSADTAGRFILSRFKTGREIMYKGAGHYNPATDADKGAEKIILEAIHKATPDFSIIAEEAGQTTTKSDYCWVIDPLDGTINFIHGYPLFAVSIGLMYRQEPVLGVIYLPCSGEMFTAIKGDGAFLNDKPIHVSKVSRLDESLLVTGFPYDRNSNEFKRSSHLFVYMTGVGQALRRDGSAAADLCFVACGRFDGFLSPGMSPGTTPPAWLSPRRRGAG